MKHNHTSFVVTGVVSGIDLESLSFSLSLLTEEEVIIKISLTTYYEVLRNIGDEWRDRVEQPSQEKINDILGSRNNALDTVRWDAKRQLLKYIRKNIMVCIQGVSSTKESDTKYYAR